MVLSESERGKDPEATVVGEVDPNKTITVIIGLAGP
jgi:hypothetical protein